METMEPLALLDIAALKLRSNRQKDVPQKGRAAIRLRPTIRTVRRTCVVAYVLSMAVKHVFSITGDCFSFISLLPTVWKALLEKIKIDPRDNFEFELVHSMSSDFLEKAVELYLNRNTIPSPLTNRLPSTSLGFQSDCSSLINRRRRQEDRWFATLDLLNYIPNSSKVVTDPPPMMAVGVFDGHHGPEVAEHCSHMAPYLLSLRLQEQMSKRFFSIPDVLANVFFELNESANEDREHGPWSSGATATICLFYGSHIYTAWAGDSQAWLFFTDQDEQHSNNVGSDKKHSADPPSSRLLKNSPTHDAREVSNLAVGLTDCIHRPEFASEFVSVLRNGGLITTEVSVEGQPPKISYFTNLVPGDVRVEQFTSSKSQTELLSLAPLENIDLVDCRVGGLSCVSRSIGDDHSVPGVRALPSMSVWRYRPTDGKRPLCLIVASDGLWDTDKCSPSDLAPLANDWARTHRTEDGSIEVGFAGELSQHAIENGSSDNVTCLVVWLDRWNPPIPDPAISYPGFCHRKNVRWPRGRRSSSSTDLQSTKSDYCDSRQMSEKRKSMPAEDYFQSHVRYSSPPRYLSTQVYC